MKKIIPLLLCTLLYSCGIVGIKSNYDSPSSPKQTYSYDLKANFILPKHSERERLDFEKEIGKHLEPINEFFFGKNIDSRSPDLSTYLREKLVANG